MLDNFGDTEYDDGARYDGTEDDTRLPIQLETRRQTSFTTDQVLVTTPTDEVIGEATAASGWPAEVTWSGLTEGETYAWYVVSRDADSGDDLAPGEVHQMDVFTATAAGTDDVAPELTIPEAATITAGDAFDPMVGVSATDNTDGDLTDAVQVIGAIDHDTPGTYVLTYVVEDSNGNQASATRAITVTEAAGGTQTGGTQDDDAANNDDASGGAGTSDDSNDAGQQTGGSADEVDETGSSVVDDAKNPASLADTGAQRALLLTLGGLLSIGAGLTAWWVSRRHKSMD